MSNGGYAANGLTPHRQFAAAGIHFWRRERLLGAGNVVPASEMRSRRRKSVFPAPESSISGAGNAFQAPEIRHRCWKRIPGAGNCFRRRKGIPGAVHRISGAQCVLLWYSTYPHVYDDTPHISRECHLIQTPPYITHTHVAYFTKALFYFVHYLMSCIPVAFGV